MRSNRRIRITWSQRHPVASDIFSGVVFMVMMSGLTFLGFAL